MGLKSRSDVGGVSRKIPSLSFYNWIRPKIFDSDLEDIVKSSGDDGKQFEILDNIFERVNLPDSFFDDIYYAERKEFLNRLEFEGVNMFPELVSDIQVGKLGFNRRKVRGFKSDDKVKSSPVKKVKVFKQTSVRGKTYSRSYNKWSKSEEMYIKINAQKIDSGQVSLDGVGKNLEKLNGVYRSKDSIKAKLRRLK